MSKGGGKGIDQIGSECAGGSELLVGDVGRQSVEVDSQNGRVERAEALANKGGDDAGQAIPRATDRKAGVAGRVAIDANSIGDQCRMRFKNDHQVLRRCKFDGGLLLPNRIRGGDLGEPGKFARVRC